MCSQIKKTWIIMQSPGFAPVKKRPLGGVENTLKMMKDLKRCFPESSLMIAELTFDDDLWLTSGDNYLSESKALSEEQLCDEEIE